MRNLSHPRLGMCHIQMCTLEGIALCMQYIGKHVATCLHLAAARPLLRGLDSCVSQFSSPQDEVKMCVM